MFTYRSRYALSDSNGNGILDTYDEFIDGYSLCDLGITRQISSLKSFQVGVKNIFDYNMQLCDILIEGLQSRNAVINSPLDKKNGSSIITAYFDGVDTETIIKSLKAAQIFVSNRAGSIRFSPHLYNNDIDIETTLTELDNII